VLIDLRARADEVAWFGAMNSVSMALLKFTSPGVPDLYQGNEIIDLSLVDPDNRRPVDYELRARLLEDLSLLADDAARTSALQQMATRPTDGRLKMWTTWRVLELRRSNPGLFRDGNYKPLRVKGAAREHVVAFARRVPGALLIVIAARLFASLMRNARAPAVGEACWSDTVVDASAVLGAGAKSIEVVNVLTGSAVQLDAGEIRMADAFSEIPAAAFLILMDDPPGAH
jgi:(1->4)-alpha-D-glucan 1-alpha-D-glucosylmutase